MKPLPYCAAPDDHCMEEDLLDAPSRQNLLPMGMSPKRNSDGEELRPGSESDFQPRKKPQMVVLEIQDIQREFELVSARLKLVNEKGADVGGVAVTGPGLSAGETTALLVQANLYEDAINIARLFDLDCRCVFKTEFLAANLK